MELSAYEKKAIKEYISATIFNRTPKDIVRDSRASIIALIQTICIEKYKLSPTSSDFNEPRKYFFESDFFGKKNVTTGRFSFHSQQLQKISNQIDFLIKNRNLEEYAGVDSSDDIYEVSIQCKAGLKIVLKWYLNAYKKYQLSSISGISQSEKEEIANLFVTTISRTERIIERENYYVILLIDSSQSMLWPYLKDPSNFDKPDTKDYKDAVSEVQMAMQFAHEKSLNAMRGSSICKEGYLKIYQYTFNSKKTVLNGPEELNPFGLDKVVKIESRNYGPDGRTALYDTIDESLKVVYDNYLKKTMENEKRIDKLIIGVVTDGEDTVLNTQQKEQKIDEIKRYLKMLRGDGDIRKSFLVSSVLIGLTGSEFSDNKLKEIKKELSFDESVSIIQADEQSIRKAFKLFSTNAINV